MKPKGDRKCEICGVFLFNRQPHAKYCKSCYLEKKKEYLRNAYHKKKKLEEWKKNNLKKNADTVIEK